MFRLRMVGSIIRTTGLGHITLVFCGLFLACSLIIAASEPAAEGWGNALWLCFQTVATIGFGDVPAATPLVRCTLAALSIVSIFYLAVVTGVVVAACNELVKAQANRSIVAFMDQIEHLDELDRSELKELSRQMKKFRQNCVHRKQQ